jgi:hypothetical protein
MLEGRDNKDEDNRGDNRERMIDRESREKKTENC